MHFSASVLQGGKTATGIQIPGEIIDQLGAGKRPPVRVNVNGYSYRTTVGMMNGKFMLPLSAEHRRAAGVAAGDAVDVEIDVDDQPRTVEVPADFADALGAEPAALQFFDTLSNSNKKWHVLSVEGAKTDETRQRRIARSVAMLRDGHAR